jgi:uncharacterized protein (DUF2237 family)
MATPLPAKNVLGGPLETCSTQPLTGYFRDGCCSTGPTDHGKHIVCAQVTQEFLEYSRAQGNDLITPVPQFQFPGLKPGDRWCLCVSRWLEALAAEVAPPVCLEATHEKVLEYVSIKVLKEYQVAE